MYPKIKIHRNVYLDVFRSILKRVNIAALHAEKGFKIDQKINLVKITLQDERTLKCK